MTRRNPSTGATVTATEEREETQQESAERVQAAVRALDEQIRAGKVRVVVGRTGGVAFQGRTDEDRGDVTDLCAYRRLLNTSGAFRAAVLKAEALAGRKVDAQQIVAGLHSHDGGQTWGKH